MALSNTSQRIIVSLIAIPLIVLVSYLGKVPFLLFVVLIGGVSFIEFSKLVNAKDIEINNTIGILSVISILANSYFEFIAAYPLIIIITLVVLIVELFRNKGSAIINIGSTLLGILYIGLFAGSILMIREFFADSILLYNQGGYLIISILATIWMCDSAAFFLGKAFGKHKLFPRVSPKKSIEGAVAGFLFSLITMVAAKELILDFLTITDAVIIGILIGIFGQIGDLVESLIKRDSEVKDSSQLIPGHGGIFDRFDSFLFSSPIVYLYLYYML
jgi:phosphatidate cytidylyltransferase